ncbi:uncharacterized protein LOC126827484 [Patella vulgata]|uniref:uncharacterized protein LOC126827484 n=1 Tax=Patella vulgata TaxID=6465 RepID=UPI00217F3C42|nr:uncharacterized protein LOC126827484 [Patella vulgata]
MDELLLNLVISLCLICPISAVNKTLSVGITKRCPAAFLNVDHYENLYLDSLPVDNANFQMNGRHEECRVSIMTGLLGHGLCLSVLHMNISCDVEIFFSTNQYEPDKKFRCGRDITSEWCTEERVMTITVKARHPQRNALPSTGPKFNFLIKAESVPLHHIRKVSYLYMDSELSCGVQHSLDQGESIRLLSHRRPHVNKEMPEMCDITVITTAVGEYEQVCFKFDKFISEDDCETEITATDLMVPYWNQNETFNCMTQINEKMEFCSFDKQLTIQLTRKSATNADFAITVQSKRQPYWEREEQVKSELVGLSIVRGLIVIVSVVNTVVALSMALVSFLHRNPIRSIRQWDIHSILYIPSRSAVLTIPNTYEGATPPEKVDTEQNVI